MSFGEKLCEAVRNKRSAVMVGIDPRWDLLPTTVREPALEQYGPTLEAVAAAYLQLGRKIIEAVAAYAPVVKFQVAFFEAAGLPGMKTLTELMNDARQAGLLVVLDGKRNDIGTTAEAYAQAWLGTHTVQDHSLAVWDADALTVTPYLGAEGIEPFLQVCDEKEKGIFVLVRTSNPGAGRLQDLRTQDGQAIYQVIADWVEEWSQTRVGDCGYGSVGAVVGATVPEHLRELRQRMPHTILLIPGYGAQGGTAADIAGAFDSRGLGAVVNNSRGILFAYRQPGYRELDWLDAAVAATRAMRDDLAQFFPS